jgi:hypothetical protein
MKCFYYELFNDTLLKKDIIEAESISEAVVKILSSYSEHINRVYIEEINEEIFNLVKSQNG